MALAATIVWEVRSGGSDNNGGGFNSAAAGTDRTLQNSAQVAIDNSTITTSITANVITFTGYSPTSADVGNVVQMLTGTNVTAGFYEITGQTSSTWTVTGAASLPTSGTTTNATGNMGGALATPGKAAGAKVASNTVYIKNSSGASPDSFLCGTTANAAAGRVNDAAANTTAAPGWWVGYESTRTTNNTDSNWPLLKASANSVTVFTMGASNGHVRNLSFGRNASETSVTGLTVSGLRASADSVKSTSVATGFTLSGTGFRLQNALADTCGTGFSSTGSGSLHGCVSKAGTGTGFTISGGGQTVVVADCVATGSAGAGFTVNHAGLLFLNCTAYGQTGASGNGFDFNTSANAQNGQLVNCVSYGNAQRNYFADSAKLDVLLLNCAGGGGGTADNYASAQSVGFITLSADPFTNAAGNDFSLNNTAGGGAALRAAGKPAAYPGLSTTSAPDVGAAQTNVTTAGGSMGARIFTGM